MTTTGSRRGERNHSTLGSTFLRVTHGRRLETGLAFAAEAARVTLVLTVGLHIAEVVLLTCASGVICYGPSRRLLVDRAQRQSKERWFGKKMAHSGLFSAREMPELRDMALSRVGWVLSIRASPHLTAEDLAKRAERLAVAFGARGVQVTRDPAHAGGSS
jgi:hypothetical protein